jgi:RNA polymerase sigma-70 factor (ECF subfamily)
MSATRALDPPRHDDGTGAPDPADAALLVAVAAGDHAAFAALYARYHAPLYRHAYRLLGEREAAEDAVQAVFLNIWRRAADFDPARGAARSWLLVSTRNAVLDAVRRRAVQARGAVSLDRTGGLASADDPAAQAEGHERRLAVRRGLGDLPAAQREALELAYFGGLTCAAIAARTAVPVGTAKGRLRLARGKLRTALAPLLAE